MQGCIILVSHDTHCAWGVHSAGLIHFSHRNEQVLLYALLLLLLLFSNLLIAIIAASYLVVYLLEHTCFVHFASFTTNWTKRILVALYGNIP